MATWRCPHCGTVQVETARCFVCDRSATSCGTCLNFRRSLVDGVGYCAAGREREPLTGSEQRPCWTSDSETVGDGLFDVSPAAAGASPPTSIVTPAASLIGGRGLIEVSRT
jgi:hypothetical protein